MLVETNTKPLEDRLSSSPGKTEKKIGGKKSMYEYNFNEVNGLSKIGNTNVSTFI